MDIVHPMRYTVDLNDGLVQKPMETRLMKGDKKANCVIVEIKNGENAVTLSGVTATGSFIRPVDDAAIPLKGSISGNVVTVELVDECYEASGGCQIDVELTAGERKRTILSVVGDVVKKGSGSYVDVSGVIPSVDDIVAQYATMKTVTAETKTAGTSAASAASAANAATTNANNAAAKITGMTASATKGTDAGVTVSEKNGVKHFDFILPKGDKGDRGEKGETGSVEHMPFYEGTPAAPGTANAGSSDMVSRGDHVHPLPQRLAYAYDNAYVTVEKTASNRSHGLGVHDPATGRSVGLYVSTDNGVPTIRYQDAVGNVKQHGLYSTANKPNAGDVGALSKEGGTASGLIKATNFVLGNASDYPSIGFQGLDVSKGQLGSIQFSAPSDGRRFSFIQYPSDQDGLASRFHESYRLPKPSAGLTKTEYYDFLTTKTPVTIAQGGTGKTTAAEALAALGAVPTGRTINGKALTGNVTLVPADIGGFVGCHEITVASDDGIAAGSTGTGSATFTAISGATRYYAVMCTTGSMWGVVTGVSISGTTLTATFYNNSTGTHTVQSKFLVIGVK